MAAVELGELGCVILLILLRQSIIDVGELPRVFVQVIGFIEVWGICPVVVGLKVGELSHQQVG